MDCSKLIAQKDLAVRGRPLYEVTVDEAQEVERITYERHRAILWLCGEQKPYSQITVDT
jgi:hypothetical protein